MSSLLHGIKFVRRSEGDDRKKDKKKKTGKKEKEHTKEHKKRYRDNTSSEREEETKEDDERIEETKTILPRDEWMKMSYLKTEADPIGTIKTAEDLNNEAKQKKIQEEIDAGMREPVTEMVYGLYDPKNPDVTPTISSKIVEGKERDIEMKGDEGEMPLFGDKGVSWRAKMLKRAQSSGVTLEKLVNERFRSVSALKEKSKGSARKNAHLQYKRHQIDDEDETRMRRG
ncbi:unnamed protein product [Peronospora destructor]|uniref:Uncharacterized protein n=1 Tax=Peronospora destructor TaxID=86335 RepID=A0AAV0UQE3_9STRA|nr:unnamed protein product [Peronospora destructor]